MARKTVVELVDDLDGSVIEAGGGEHITFLALAAKFGSEMKIHD